MLLSVEGNGRKRSCEREKVKSALNVLSRLKYVSNMMIVNWYHSKNDHVIDIVLRGTHQSAVCQYFFFNCSSQTPPEKVIYITPKLIYEKETISRECLSFVYDKKNT